MHRPNPTCKGNTCKVDHAVAPCTRPVQPVRRLRCRAAAASAVGSMEMTLPASQSYAPRDVVPAGGPAAVAPVSQAQRRQFLMEDTRDFIKADLKRIFGTGEISAHRYSPTIRFEDPISKYDSLSGYLLNIRLLRTLFQIDFDLHTIEVSGADTISARWSMGLEFWPAPWKPQLMFTGTTTYQVDPDTGIILSHVDTWDAVEHTQFLSLEALIHAARQLAQVQLTPSGLAQPKYKVLKKLKDYELRYYEPFLVATTDMGAGAGPASGTGFMELANYIFGDNKQQVKMEMTTPVLNDIETGSQASTSMSFVMENRFTDVAQLPAPSGGRVVTRGEPGAYYAVTRFSGWPLDFEVVQAERGLRDALVRDGLTPQPGGAYKLLRYNEPTVLPFLRRNEVLIALDNFSWP